MFHSLRNRLILSHILPMLIIIPLMGVALILVFETQIYLPSLARSLESNAFYLADILNRSEIVWVNPLAAQSLLDQSIRSQLGLDNTARLMLLTPNGVLLASTNRNDLGHLGEPLPISSVQLAAIHEGQPISLLAYSQSSDAEVIDVMVPVISNDGRLLGAVRMTYQYATIADEFNQVQLLIGGLLLVALIAGSIIGSVLAVNIGRPIRQVTRAVDELARGAKTELLEVSGPSEVKTLAGAFNILVTRLRELERSRRQLLANLVHELGRPLGALRSAIQALSSGAERDPGLYQELLDGMNEETARLQHLLSELASLHDQVLGTLELDRRSIRLQEWLPGNLATWQEAAREKRLHWELEIDPNVPAIQADPVRLAQIIGNLVSNAIKFTPTGGEVKVKAEPCDGRGEKSTEGGAMITVADTGPGMSEEEQEKIFIPFYRGSVGRRFPQGMGLGLSIARDLVLAHGGTLEVDSAPGAGSRFTVKLP